MPFHTDQALLAAVDLQEEIHILCILGERAKDEEVISGHDPLVFFDRRYLPDQPGLHVWEGNIYDDIEDVTSWSGYWRPAVLGDFPRFGLLVPQ
jgi:hypothetical protein